MLSLPPLRGESDLLAHIAVAHERGHVLDTSSGETSQNIPLGLYELVGCAPRVLEPDETALLAVERDVATCARTDQSISTNNGLPDEERTSRPWSDVYMQLVSWPLGVCDGLCEHLPRTST